MSASTVLRPEHRARWGPICGVLFVVLLVVSFVIVFTPSTSKSPQYLLDWYSKNSHKTQLHVSLVIGDIATVFGLFWFGYLKDRFGRSDLGDRLSPIFLAGAILFASGGLVFSGAQFALSDDPKKMEPATAQTLNFLAQDIGIGGLVAGISILMWAAGFIIFKTGVLPRWLAWVSFVVAVVALAGPLGFFAFLATGVWVLIVAFYMWRHELALPISDDAGDLQSAVTAG
jgi:hypothetical protein